MDVTNAGGGGVLKPPSSEGSLSCLDVSRQDPPHLAALKYNRQGYCYLNGK